MAVASKKMKSLDITNYLAAGTSLKAFYESYCVSTPKWVFPYSLFDSLEKLDATSLPDDIEVFRSILTKKTSHRTYLNRVETYGRWKVWLRLPTLLATITMPMLLALSKLSTKWSPTRGIILNWICLKTLSAYQVFHKNIYLWISLLNFHLFSKIVKSLL